MYIWRFVELTSSFGIWVILESLTSEVWKWIRETERERHTERDIERDRKRVRERDRER